MRRGAALVGVAAMLAACRPSAPPPAKEPTPPLPVVAAEPASQAPERAPLERPEDDGVNLPAYGLADLDAACARLVAAAARYDEDLSCDPEDARMAESEDWGLLLAEGMMEHRALVVRTEDGWTLDAILLDSWTSGAEQNYRFDGASLGSWKLPDGEPLLVLEYRTHFTDFEGGVAPEHGTEVLTHEVVVCMREPTWARCSGTITIYSERRYPLPEQRYDASVILDGDALVAAGPELDGYEARFSAHVAPHRYLEPGRYPLEGLF